MDDLHSRIRTELDRRLAIARQATPGPWIASTHPVGVWPPELPADAPDSQAWLISTSLSLAPEADAAYLAAHQPSDAILRYTRDLAVLERHRDCQKGGLHGHGHNTAAWCDVCWTVHPCPEITLLIESLGIPTTPKGDDE